MNGLKNNRHRHDDALSHIDHREFERLLGAYYRGQGWQVEYTGTGSTAQRFDGGVDLVLRRDDEVVLVQCKHWNAKQVPHNPVHELLGIMVNRGATGAILITSGEFTRAAIEAATRNGHVQLVDGHDLRDMLGELPEPAPPPAQPIGTTPSRYGTRVARKEGDRLARRGGDEFVVKLLVALVGLIIIAVAFAVAISAISKSGQSPKRLISPPHHSPMQVIDHKTRPSRKTAPLPEIRKLSPEEAEAQRQRSTESLEIIKKTTPEWGERRE